MASGAHLIEDFLEMMRAERGVTPNTSEAYLRDLTHFLFFTQSRHTQLADVTQEDIERYIASLDKAFFAPRTLARRLSSLRQFYQFLYGEKLCKEDPTATIEGPKQGRSLPKTLAREDMDALLRVAHEQKDSEGLRLAALLEILYASGLRVSELVALPFHAIRNAAAQKEITFLSVMGKGGKERLVPLGEAAMRALGAYLAVRDDFIKEGEESAWLFPSPLSGQHLTRQRLGQMLKILALKAGVDPQMLSPHAIRHTFASHLLAGGADLRVIQELLGHSDITTTQVYTLVEHEALTTLVTTCHPLAKKK